MTSIDIFISETNEIEMEFVCRNFNVGNSVKTYFKKRFYSGEVIKKYFEEGFFGIEPFLLIKTDEKVDNESDALLNGLDCKDLLMENI